MTVKKPTPHQVLRQALDAHQKAPEAIHRKAGDVHISREQAREAISAAIKAQREADGLQAPGSGQAT